MVQSSDVAQYIWGKLFGRRRIAPTVSPNKTWEGFVGGIATATLIGTGSLVDHAVHAVAGGAHVRW